MHLLNCTYKFYFIFKLIPLTLLIIHYYLLYIITVTVHGYKSSQLFDILKMSVLYIRIQIILKRKEEGVKSLSFMHNSSAQVLFQYCLDTWRIHFGLCRRGWETKNIYIYSFFWFALWSLHNSSLSSYHNLSYGAQRLSQ